MEITAADIARAAEALNRHPDLSPTARRLGIELLNRIRRDSGTCWPSMSRLAVALDRDERTIRRAKAELISTGILTCRDRGGRLTPIYAFIWGTLQTLANTIKARIKAVCDSATGKKDNTPSPPAPGFKTAENGSARPVGRTSTPAYLTPNILQKVVGRMKIATASGNFRTSEAPKNQFLDDSALDRKASARLWDALSRLTPAQLAQFLDRPDADTLQAKAIKAERFNPGTGLSVLRDLVGGLA